MEIVTKERLLEYLQSKFDHYQMSQARFGDDPWNKKELDGLIACKEMAETLLEEKVEFQRKDRPIRRARG